MLTRELLDEYVHRCLEAESPPRATELAATLNVSRQTLNHWSRVVLGRPLTDYLRARQIARARTLLESTSLPVTRIACLAGYGTPRSLFRAFARATGVTPGLYRMSLTKRL